MWKVEIRAPPGLRRAGSRRPPQNQTYQSNAKLVEHMFDCSQCTRDLDSPSIPPIWVSALPDESPNDYRAPMTDPSPKNVLEDPCVRRVAAALASFGVRGQITVLDEAAQTARQAADVLGIEIAQIANSLVFRAHRNNDKTRPLLVLTSGVHRVDPIKVADLLELSAISLADAEFVSKHTGFAVGGVAPIAPSHAIETVVDVSLSRYGQVWAAAGHPRTVFPTSYDELLRLTGGHPAEVA